MSKVIRQIWLVAWLAGIPAAAEAIYWFSDADGTNLDSGGALMDARFRFEIGVFADAFVPSAANMNQWARHWRPAARTPYNAVSKRFSDVFTVTENPAPFTVGAAAYIWGFRGDAVSGEWILFRHPDWEWPEPNAINPLPPEWNAANATPILGGINASGSPFLMQSAAVTNAAPPDTTWAQWRAEFLTGESLDRPGDDPDKDGVSNLIEFVFGTPPKQAGPPPVTPVGLAETGGEKFLQIAIPRRIDHPATLVVEVSGDLIDWHAGDAHTMVVSDTVDTLLVRDKTPFAPPVTKRFMRLRASLP
jgi:hypothetical protein